MMNSREINYEVYSCLNGRHWQWQEYRANAFADLGINVIDADIIARRWLNQVHLRYMPLLITLALTDCC